MAVQVEVVRRQLGHPQDGLLTLVFDCPHAIRLLRLLHQRLLKTGDHLTLRVDVLDNTTPENTKCNRELSAKTTSKMATSNFNLIFTSSMI